MKLTTEYIKQLVLEQMQETNTSRFSTPHDDEGRQSPIINAKNQITAAIAALTMLSSDSQIPLKSIERTIERLEKTQRILDKHGDS